MFDEDPHYYVKMDGQSRGPIRFDVLQAWAREGRIDDTAVVWSSTDGKWRPTSEIEGLRVALISEEPGVTSRARRLAEAAAGAVLLGYEKIRKKFGKKGRRRR